MEEGAENAGIVGTVDECLYQVPQLYLPSGATEDYGCRARQRIYNMTGGTRTRVTCNGLPVMIFQINFPILTLRCARSHQTDFKENYNYCGGKVTLSSCASKWCLTVDVKFLGLANAGFDFIIGVFPLSAIKHTLNITIYSRRF